MDRFSCASAHSELIRYVSAIITANRRLDRDTALLARLGMTCVAQSAQKALLSHTEVAALRAWTDCALGEQQLRDAIFRAFRHGSIDTDQFDHVFVLLKRAAEHRASERIRLRQRILYHAY